MMFGRILRTSHLAGTELSKHIFICVVSLFLTKTLQKNFFTNHCLSPEVARPHWPAGMNEISLIQCLWIIDSETMPIFQVGSPLLPWPPGTFKDIVQWLWLCVDVFLPWHPERVLATDVLPVILQNTRSCLKCLPQSLRVHSPCCWMARFSLVWIL